jgi:RHS repeat-associated protein
MMPDWPDNPMSSKGVEDVLLRTYQPGGFPKSETDGSGVGFTFETDGFGRIIASNDATGGAMWQGYDTRNRVVWRAFVGPGHPPYHRPEKLSLAMPLIAMSEYSYDGLDRLTRESRWHFQDGISVDPGKLKSITTYEYDDDKNTVRMSTDGKPSIEVVLDERNARSSLVVNGARVFSQSIRERGTTGDEIVSVLNSQGVAVTRRSEFNNQSRLERVLDNGNVVLESFSYDRFGTKISSTSLEHGTNMYGYDGFDRLTSVKWGAKQSPDSTILLGWNRDNQQISVTTANANTSDNTTTLQWDGLGRLVNVNEPLAGATTIDYFPGTDRVHHVTNPAQTAVTQEYDAAGRLQLQSVQSGLTSGLDQSTIKRTFTFDGLGHLRTVVQDAKELDFSYDSLGCQTGESNNGFLPFNIVRTCDPQGNAVATKLAAPQGQALVIFREFDLLGRTTAVRANDRVVATLHHSGLGDPTQINFGAGLIKSDALIGADGHPIGSLITASGAEIASVEDNLGSDGIPRIRQQKAGERSVTDLFEVDERGRLIAEAQEVPDPPRKKRGETVTNTDVDASIETAPSWRRYVLDGLANWSTLTSNKGTIHTTVNSLNAYSKFGDAAATYDGAYGLTGLADYSGKFDGLGRLVRQQKGNVTFEYEYDPIGRRILERNRETGHTTNLIWDGDSIATIGRDGSNAEEYTVAVEGDWNQPLALLGSFGNGAVSYLHRNWNGSVIAASGEKGLLESYSYSAFGETRVFDATATPINSSRIGNQFLFQGQWHNALTGSYFMRAREYVPEIGRFLSRDPLGFRGGANLYSFAGGRPLTEIDPLGLIASELSNRARISDVELNAIMKQNNLSSAQFDALRKLITPEQRERIRASDPGSRRLPDPIGEVRERTHVEASEAFVKVGYASIAASLLLPFTLPALEASAFALGTRVATATPWLIPLSYDIAAGQIGAPPLSSFIAIESAGALPTVTFDYNRAPELVENMYHAMRAGYAPGGILTYAGGRLRSASKLALQEVRVYKALSQSWDEFPFASTLEAGLSSWVGRVPAWQQSYQGATLGNFYRQLKAGDRFRVLLTNLPSNLP